jgi:hypothetical protein
VTIEFLPGDENIDIHHKLAANQLNTILHALGQKEDDEHAKTQMILLINYFATMSGTCVTSLEGKELLITYQVPIGGKAYDIPQDDLKSWPNAKLFHIMCMFMAQAGITPKQTRVAPDLYAMAKARRDRQVQ